MPDDDEYLDYSSEFLEKRPQPGCPPQLLTLFRYCSAMLIRNLDPTVGAVNGSHYLVGEMHDKILVC